MKDIIEVIQEKSDLFTNSQKIVANYIVENINGIAFTTLDDLAENIGVSTTTIIRFSRTLGYSGYAEMQKSIRSVLKNKDSLPDRANDTIKIPSNLLMKNILENEINNINKTINLQSEKDLEEVVSQITDAKNVYVIGMRSSYSLAAYLTSRLGQIKRNTHLIQSPGMMYPEEITGAKEGDICIAFLFPRYSKTTTTIISWLKEKGVKVILFTSENNTIIKGYGDIILPCVVSDVSFKNSFSAPICLINYIVAATLQKNPDEALDILDETEKLLSKGYYLGLI